MAKKTVLDYSNLQDLFKGRTVVVGLTGGTNLSGEVHYVDDDKLVLVTEPKSSLEIETKVVHTVVSTKRIDFVQFKTDRE